MIARQAVDLINTIDPNKEQLYLYLPFQAVHGPIEVRFHYENLPIQDIEIFFFQYQKLKILSKCFLYFSYFCSSRGGSNEYQQFMFWSKNKKNRYTPVYPSLAI